jgi:xanthine dehydrogenase accessory factor
MPDMTAAASGQSLSVHPALMDPWTAATAWGAGSVVGLLTATHGPAYRNPGAAIAVGADGRLAGAVTSGCIESDLIVHAEEIRRTGQARRLRYGDGSPFFDLRLPCGGAIDILLFEVKDFDVLVDLSRARRDRRPVAVAVSQDGRLSLGSWRPTGEEDTLFHLSFRPALRFLIFGTGAEPAVFSGLLRGMGYDHLLVSHDEATLAPARAAGTAVKQIRYPAALQNLQVDTDTAIVLFYHDHDHEPEVLRSMLRTSAFYIGAQGSRATHARRLAVLQDMGMASAELTRISSPIGLIPSSRDPKALAISVLAEVLDYHAAKSA